MASNYPTSIDSFTDPLSNSPLNNPSHAAQHQDVNDAVEKLETKLGVGSSPASGAASGHVLVANGSGSTTWQAPAVTAAQFATVGLMYITQATIGNGVTSTTVANCFSSTYDHYLIQVVGTRAGAQVGTSLQLSGITTGYDFQGFYMAKGSSTIVGFNTSNTSSWDFGATDTNASLHEMLVMNPNKAIAKTCVVRNSASGGTTLGVQVFGQNASTSTATGFVFSVGSSTLTGGTIFVYGYRKA